MKYIRLFALLAIAILVAPVIARPLVAFAATEEEVKAIFEDSVFYDPNDGCTASVRGSGATTNSLYMIGDSLTVGMNNASLGQYAISELFTAQGWNPTINAQGCRPLYNASSPDGFEGDGSACPLGTITSAFNEFEKDKSTIATAGAVVVALGTNNYERDQQLFHDKGVEYVQKIRSANPSIGNNIYWVNTYTKGGGLSERSAMIDSIVKDTGIQLIDFRSVAKDEVTYSYPSNDTRHHDANGYRHKSEFIVNSIGPPVLVNGASQATGITGFDPTILSFPGFPDETAIAQGIEATIRRRSPTSGWLSIPNLGQRLIDEGRTYNVNPLMIVASGNTESGFGTSRVGRTYFNSFGRTSSGTDYINFGSFEADLFGERGFPRTVARNLYEGGVGGRYAAAKDIYEYFSIHQTGQIHYPGDGMYLEDKHTNPPTVVSWDSPYNPLQYYKLNIGIINEITGLTLPSDKPPHGAGSLVTGNTCLQQQGAGAKVPGVGGYDLPGGSNPMVYYSQLASGADPAVEVYAGSGTYGIGSIQDCGCGPTSLAMVISTITDRRVEPQEMATWAAANGLQDTSCGTNIIQNQQKIMNEFKIQAFQIRGTDQIAQSLLSGKLVIASVTSFPLPGKPVSHITVIRKYENGLFYFADSFADGWSELKDVSRHGYSSEDLASMIFESWEITPYEVAE